MHAKSKFVVKSHRQKSAVLIVYSEKCKKCKLQSN